jgi:hypothetical protein
MKYAAEMGSAAMIYIPEFIKISSEIQKLTGGIHMHTDRMVIAKFFVYFFKTWKAG